MQEASQCAEAVVVEQLVLLMLPDKGGISVGEKDSDLKFVFCSIQQCPFPGTSPTGVGHQLGLGGRREKQDKQSGTPGSFPEDRDDDRQCIWC